MHLANILLCAGAAPIMGKFLLLQSDTRNLDGDFSTADYHTLTAVTNFVWAKQHNADYLYFVFNQTQTDFLADAHRTFGATFLNKSSDKSTEITGTYLKKGPTCYHPVLKQFRAAPWTKLLALWNVSQSALVSRYSHIFFLDSDAVINPLFHRRSLDDALVDWSKSTCHAPSVTSSNAAAVFLDNSPFHPYEKHLCDGAFVLNLGFKGVVADSYAINHSQEKGAAFISNFIKEWWDHDVESKDFNHWWHHDSSTKNFNHAYEQDSLWDQIYNPKTSWRINSNTICVIGEPQFPPDRNDSLWVMHVGSPWEKDRRRLLKDLLHQLRFNDKDFADVSQYITQAASVAGNAIHIARAMSECL